MIPALKWIGRDQKFIKAYLENFENELKELVYDTIRNFELQERKDEIEQRERDDAEDDARQYQIREDIKNGELYRD